MARVQQVELASTDGVQLKAVLRSAREQGHRGVVIQAHSINADMDEGDMLVRLADRTDKIRVALASI